MDPRDREELELLLADAPTPGQVAEGRHVSVDDLQREHEIVRRERAMLAADGEWID